MSLGRVRAMLRMLDRMASRLAAALVAVYAGTRAEFSLVTLESLIKSNDAPEAIASEQRRRMIPAFREVISSAMAVAGEAAIPELSELAGEQISWQKIQPRIARLSVRFAAARVTGITDAQRDALRALIEEAETEGLRVGQIARRVRESIGLDQRQAAALENFRSYLEGRDVEPKAVKRLTGQYRKRLIVHRAKRIAKTETQDALQRGLLKTWASAQDDGDLAEEWMKEWIGILRDGRICKVCHGTHGQRREIRDPFDVAGRELQAPTAHPECRCNMRLVLASDPDDKKPPFVEPKGGGSLRPMLPEA